MNRSETSTSTKLFFLFLSHEKHMKKLRFFSTFQLILPFKEILPFYLWSERPKSFKNLYAHQRVHEEHQSPPLDFPIRETAVIELFAYVSFCCHTERLRFKVYDPVWNSKRNTLSTKKYPLLVLHQRRIWNSRNTVFLHEQMAMITSQRWLDTELDKEADEYLCINYLSVTSSI